MLAIMTLPPIGRPPPPEREPLPPLQPVHRPTPPQPQPSNPGRLARNMPVFILAAAGVLCVLLVLLCLVFTTFVNVIGNQ
jgi:hypothetical protein